MITLSERFEILNNELMQAEYLAQAKAHKRVVKRSADNMQKYVAERLRLEQEALNGSII